MSYSVGIEEMSEKSQISYTGAVGKMSYFNEIGQIGELSRICPTSDIDKMSYLHGQYETY